MSNTGYYVKEVEIKDAILEARNLNMGNTVPTTTIIRQAAKLAKCDVKDVIRIYYDKELDNV